MTGTVESSERGLRGICTGVKYPLLRTLNRALVERELGR